MCLSGEQHPQQRDQQERSREEAAGWRRARGSGGPRRALGSAGMRSAAALPGRGGVSSRACHRLPWLQCSDQNQGGDSGHKAPSSGLLQ